MPPSELEILGQPGLDLQPAIDWYKRGGVAGSLGMQPVDQALAAAGSQPLTIGSGRDIMPAIMSGMDSPMLGFGVSSIEGYHGTPHTFAPEPGAPLGRFKNEAIGSGEGAQAYGYGHYVAGNKSVAERYQKDLSTTGWKGRAASFDDTTIYDGGTGFTEHAKDFPQDGRDALSAVVSEGGIDNALNYLRTYFSVHDSNPGIKQIQQDNFRIADWLEANKERISYKDPAGGSLLEVHILPDEHELLDWDKPVTDKFFANKKFKELTGREEKQYPVTGSEIYRSISNYLGSDKAASAALHEAGIPGIKYLDAGSRGLSYEIHSPENLSLHGIRFDSEQQALDHINYRLGQNIANGPIVRKIKQTHNYVIFHSDNLRIIGRNGQRLEPVDHDPFGSAP